MSPTPDRHRNGWAGRSGLLAVALVARGLKRRGSSDWIGFTMSVAKGCSSRDPRPDRTCSQATDGPGRVRCAPRSEQAIDLPGVLEPPFHTSMQRMPCTRSSRQRRCSPASWPGSQEFTEEPAAHGIEVSEQLPTPQAIRGSPPSFPTLQWRPQLSDHVAQARQHLADYVRGNIRTFWNR